MSSINESHIYNGWGEHSQFCSCGKGGQNAQVKPREALTNPTTPGVDKTHAANLPDQSLEGPQKQLELFAAASINLNARYGDGEITIEQYNDKMDARIAATLQFFARECAKARLEELEAAKANFVGKKYYQDPVEYLEDRTKKLKEEL